MKKIVPLDPILSADVEQRTVELILGQKKNFTKKQILRKVSALFPFVTPAELSDEVKKVLSDLLQTGVIKVNGQTCTPDKETCYKVGK